MLHTNHPLVEQFAYQCVAAFDCRCQFKRKLARKIRHPTVWQWL